MIARSTDSPHCSIYRDRFECSFAHVEYTPQGQSRDGRTHGLLILWLKRAGVGALAPLLYMASYLLQSA